MKSFPGFFLNNFSFLLNTSFPSGLYRWNSIILINTCHGHLFGGEVSRIHSSCHVWVLPSTLFMWIMLHKSTLLRDWEHITENRAFWAHILKQFQPVLKARSRGKAGRFSEVFFRVENNFWYFSLFYLPLPSRRWNWEHIYSTKEITHCQPGCLTVIIWWKSFPSWG